MAELRARCCRLAALFSSLFFFLGYRFCFLFLICLLIGESRESVEFVCDGGGSGVSAVT